MVAKKDKTAKNKGEKKGFKTPAFLKAIGGYFKGSWQELRQVRWTTRRATWKMTLAVIIFTVFFITLIVLLDAGFDLLFKLLFK